ncbi:hypothetical protein [Brumimicrobium mesophilum]|uniref:hypothetical protein n=1 Tax=Brumimicrobium mesophilum TaxID=392717 RepID=UPI000D143DC4|nr:hypothetical protein [Brumimicrobium mesophilum]
MKTTTTIMAILLISLTSIIFSQIENYETPDDEPIINTQTIVNYKLYPTNNKWIFIKLNTQNGLLWQVKIDIDGNNRFETNLNSLSLVNKENEENNRFTLYPTTNIYTFIVMDQINGNLWQVHWSEYPEERYVIPIE